MAAVGGLITRGLKCPATSGGGPLLVGALLGVVARWVNCARRDLCGGRSVRDFRTAIKAVCSRYMAYESAMPRSFPNYVPNFFSIWVPRALHTP